MGTPTMVLKKGDGSHRLEGDDEPLESREITAENPPLRQLKRSWATKSYFCWFKIMALVVVFIVHAIFILNQPFLNPKKTTNNVLDGNINTSGGSSAAISAAILSKEPPSAAPLPGKVFGKRYFNQKILEHGCSVTVLLTEPKFSPQTFLMLESVASNLHPIETSCFLLQTSSCRLVCQDKHVPLAGDTHSLLLSSIRNNSMKKFRDLIDNGNVRTTVMNHTKYNMRGCDDFRPMNNAWLNYEYWGDDSFVAEDSDMILMVQSDALLCHGLDAKKWSKYAFVGAPWPPKFRELRLWFPTIFYNWHKGRNVTIPWFPSRKEMYKNSSLAPVGNGGLSIRSRFWMRKAIEYCPTKSFSGLSSEVLESASCIASTNLTNINIPFMNEDMFFAIILRHLTNVTAYNGESNADRLPSAYEAALFSSEMGHPKDFEMLYKIKRTDLLNMVTKLWSDSSRNYEQSNEVKGETAMERYHRMRRNSNFIVSIGLHQIKAHIGNESKYPAFYSVLKKECHYFS